MDIEKQKKRIIEQVGEIEDAYVLKQIEDLLSTGMVKEPVVAYSVDGEPMTKKDLIEDLLAAKERARNGDTISQEDLEKEAESWLWKVMCFL